MKSAKIHTGVWIAQDTTESREPRLNVGAKILLMQTIRLGSLDFCILYFRGHIITGLLFNFLKDIYYFCGL